MKSRNLVLRIIDLAGRSQPFPSQFAVLNLPVDDLNPVHLGRVLGQFNLRRRVHRKQGIGESVSPPCFNLLSERPAGAQGKTASKEPEELCRNSFHGLLLL